MIIINFTGALGNQLFQYALYSKLQSMNKLVKADTKMFEKGTEKREFYLPLLGIQLEKATNEEIMKYARSFSRKDRLLTKLKYKNPYYEDNPVYCFQQNVLKMDSVYLNGYWQCEHYFKDIRDILLKRIEFPSFNKENRALQKSIECTNSVAIHIRMGDYLLLSEAYGGICTKEYYNKAVRYIRERVKHPVFFVFSDDISKAKELFGENDYIWISENSEENAYHDMHLMSLCKHNIIANSSFSWWAAWLNQNSDKIVITPNRWLNTRETKDVWCKEWIRM